MNPNTRRLHEMGQRIWLDNIFELALQDLTQAADLFRPIFDSTRGADGWVSLEVSPQAAGSPPGLRAPRTHKICAESFRGGEHLQRILQETQAIVDVAISHSPTTHHGGPDA